MEHGKSEEAAFDSKSFVSISHHRTPSTTHLQKQHEVATKICSGSGTTRRSAGQEEQMYE